jgi:glutathione S-transferase
MSLPVLYSYRRCPYAMRARMALHYANISVEIREISLRHKPASMLALSPKGTVPVLVLADGLVLEQSLDIMHWALSQSDTEDWRYQQNAQAGQLMQQLIAHNDGDFKAALDRYKYPERYPQHTQDHYRQQGEQFLQLLEARLQAQTFLCGDHLSLADIAIFPFVRQFAKVDADWFAQSPYAQLAEWLKQRCESALFAAIMQKYPVWQAD